MATEKETTAPIPSVAPDGEQPSALARTDSITEIEETHKQFGKIQIMTMPELMETRFRVRPAVIDGLLPVGTYLLAGAPKIGKSFLVLQMAYQVSMGTPFLGFSSRQGTVLYLALEDIQSPAFINGNKLLIEKVFSNLISNAVKYSPHGASVDIILQNTNGRFLFSVENTGTHIPEDDIPKLFDAFYRMEQSRSRRTGGSGLGLYMVQRILQQHNSYCEACNTENGVKFFFTI